MPSDDGFRLDDEEHRLPAGLQAREPDPKDAVAGAKSRLSDRPLENNQLLPQREVLGQQGGSADQKSTQEQENGPEKCHRSTFHPSLGRQILRPNGACGK